MAFHLAALCALQINQLAKCNGNFCTKVSFGPLSRQMSRSVICGAWWVGRLGFFPLLFTQGYYWDPTPHDWEVLMSRNKDIINEGIRLSAHLLPAFPTSLSPRVVWPGREPDEGWGGRSVLAPWQPSWGSRNPGSQMSCQTLKLCMDKGIYIFQVALHFRIQLREDLLQTNKPE